MTTGGSAAACSPSATDRDRAFTGHFYGHLLPGERERFLEEAGRVAGELVVVDSALREGVDAEEWQERVLNDGRWFVVIAAA